MSHQIAYLRTNCTGPGEVQIALQIIMLSNQAAKPGPLPPAVVYHGSDRKFTAADMSDCLGMHFGSATAATERLQTTNRLNSSLTVVERDDGQWIVEEEIFVGDAPFEHGPFESEASAEAFSSLHEARRSPGAFHVDIRNPVLLDDLGQWAFNAVFSHLSRIDLLNDADERDAIWDSWQTSDAQGWESLRGALHKRGFDSIAYVNDVEDKGSISWVALCADQIAPAAGDEVADSPSALRCDRPRG